MTESLYFEANRDKAAELDRLASRLGVHQEDLLKEALDLLLACHRDKQQGEEPIGMLADLHALMGRFRAIIKELDYIRFTTCGAESMLYEYEIEGRALEGLSSHYKQIYDSSERALAAAGFGPKLIHVLEAEEQ